MSDSVFHVDADKAWIETFTGHQFHLLDPRQDEIFIDDIAHSLGMQVRFTGHVQKFYSVAEHSVHCSYLVPAEDALWALLHDSSEAYMADMNRPLKHFTKAGPAYREIEKKVMQAICKKFSLPQVEPESITKADTEMLFAEKQQIMGKVVWVTMENAKVANREIRCWSPRISEIEFLHRFYELTNQL